MTVQKIPVDRIDLPKADPQIRTLGKEPAEKLAQSIRIEGLIQPVVLRPNPGSPGRYLLVCGRHRHHAVAKILKLKSIEAIVRDDLDEGAAERLALAENLWQCPLKNTQRERAAQKYFQAYLGMLEGGSGGHTTRGRDVVAGDGRTSHGEGTGNARY